MLLQQLYLLLFCLQKDPIWKWRIILSSFWSWSMNYTFCKFVLTGKGWWHSNWVLHMTLPQTLVDNDKMQSPLSMVWSTSILIQWFFVEVSLWISQEMMLSSCLYCIQCIIWKETSSGCVGFSSRNIDFFYYLYIFQCFDLKLDGTHEIVCFYHVRILTSFGAGDLGTEVDFLYTMMWVTKVTF